MADREFEGRTALVTGGARGIGRATCVRLAQAGARVAINYVGREDAARETLKLAEAEGAKAMVVQADVSDPGQVEAMVGAVEAELGPVDLLVANAGVMKALPHTELTHEDWRRTMAVNVDGVFLSIMAVKDGMLERGYGRIVCLASIAGLVGRPMMIDYAVSKAAVVAIARNFSGALAPAVRINAVAPGLTDTDMVAGAGADWRQSVIADTPLERMGTADEIAEMVLFQLSDRSSFSTGQTMVADGGRITLP